MLWFALDLVMAVLIEMGVAILVAVVREDVVEGMVVVLNKEVPA